MSTSHQHPDTLPNALDWATEAVCQAFEPSLFFTESKTGVDRAKSVCGRCPVRVECLDMARRAEDGSRYGIYGGLTPAERTELVGSEPRTGRLPAPCGTRSAHSRHVKKGEPIDDACRAAKREDDRRYRATRTTRP
jgi:hypothetical protein